MHHSWINYIEKLTTMLSISTLLGSTKSTTETRAQREHGVLCELIKETDELQGRLTAFLQDDKRELPIKDIDGYTMLSKFHAIVTKLNGYAAYAYDAAIKSQLP